MIILVAFVLFKYYNKSNDNAGASDDSQISQKLKDNITHHASREGSSNILLTRGIRAMREN